jgi:hypothetical protein
MESARKLSMPPAVPEPAKREQQDGGYASGKPLVHLSFRLTRRLYFSNQTLTNLPSAPIHKPTTQHYTAPVVSEEIIAATEKGMMGENLVGAGNWSSPRVERPLQPSEGVRKEVLTRAEEASSCSPDSLKSGERKAWDGVGEDGCRHVRWKGRDA